MTLAAGSGSAQCSPAMLAPRPRRLALAAAVLALVSAPAFGCKKKPVEEVKKDIVKKVEIVEAPMPEGAVGEIVIKDPEAFLKKVAGGAGLEPLVGASPYQKLLDSVTDENARKAIKAIDPHGAMAVLGLYKVGAPGEKAHGVGAAKLKDPDVATAALEAATKAGTELKSWDSVGLAGKAYEATGGGELAVYGDVVLVADTREALEAAGKYVAWRAAKSTIDHEMTIRIPMDKIGPDVHKLGTSEYAKVKPTDLPPKVKAEIDPLVEPVLGAVAEMGQAVIHFDVVGDDLKVEESVGAKASLAAWLAKYPTGDASALLSMPKAENVALYRLPDGLGPLAYALADFGTDGTPLSTAERADAGKQLRALGKSFGHVVAYATDAGKGAAPAPGAPPSVNTEVYVRVDLDDAAAAKGAATALRKLAEKAFPGAKKMTTNPYKKNGAEGESIATPATIPGMGSSPGGATKDTWTWAIKGSQLHLDVCLGCVPSLIDTATEGKATLGDDPAAKAKIAEMPGKGIASASWGTALSLPGMSAGLGAMMGAAPTPKKPGAAMWGYSLVDDKGLTAKGVVPLVFVGDLAKSLIAVAGMGMMGGGGMGGAPPF